MDPLTNACRRVVQIRSFLRKDDMPCKIAEGLYLGSYGAAGNKSAMKSLNITHILTVSTSITPLYPTEFVYKTVSISDRESVDISKYFEECCKFIDEAKRDGGGVLVHCFQGRSRSVTIVVAYLMSKRLMRYAEAMKHVRRRRPEAAPNSGFIQQLQDLEKNLLLNNI